VTGLYLHHVFLMKTGTQIPARTKGLPHRFHDRRGSPFIIGRGQGTVLTKVPSKIQEYHQIY